MGVTLFWLEGILKLLLVLVRENLLNYSDLF